MKITEVNHYGGPEQIDITETDPPIAEDGEIIVSLVASSINPIDVKTMAPDTVQKIKSFPMTLGWDVAGIVTEKGSNTDFNIGDRVLAMNPPKSHAKGAWQQKLSIDANHLVKVPDNIDLTAAAALPLGALTAYQSLSRLTLSTDTKLLVTGAAGTVGGYAVQLAKHQGIEVHGLVRKENQKDTVLNFGASQAHTSIDTLPKFDAIFDTAGISDISEILKENGQLVTVSDDDITETVREQSALAEHHYIQQNSKQLQYLISLVEKDELKLRVEAIFPFHKIREAVEKFNEGGHNGKIVISF